MSNYEAGEAGQLIARIEEAMSNTIVGQHKLIRSLIIGLLSGGHVLLEGVPGLAKTLAIKTLANSIDGSFQRIQFTPDLLPSDITGTMVYSQRDEDFRVKRGPVFANFVLADEINRAPAKVQSALLEAMQEGRVSIGDETMPLPTPFLVLATQNPIEQEGTYHLPEAQTDRFMLKTIVGYPTIEEEMKIMRANIDDRISSVDPVCSTSDVMKAREIVKNVYIDEKVERYICDIVFATRTPKDYGLDDLTPMISYGGSPRASISMAKAARSFALMSGRQYVTPDDVREVAHDVLCHRIGLSYEAEANLVSCSDIVGRVLSKIEVP